MVFRSFTASVMLVAFACQAWSQEGATFPQGPSPRFLVVHSVDKDVQQFTYYDFVQKVRLRTKEVTETSVSGPDIKNLKRVVVVEYAEHYDEAVLKRVQLRDFQIADATGKKVPEQQFWQQLKSGSVILMSTNGKMVDSAYLRAVRPDTLIIVPTAASNPQEEGPKKLPELKSRT